MEVSGKRSRWKRALAPFAVAAALLGAKEAQAQQIETGCGYYNAGRLVDEPKNYVRLGNSGGNDLHCSLRLVGKSRLAPEAELLLLHTPVNIWSKEEARGTRYEVRSRFAYRPKNSVDDILFTCLTVGAHYRFTTGTAGSLGIGICSLGGYDHDEAGAAPMHNPFLNASLRARTPAIDGMYLYVLVGAQLSHLHESYTVFKDRAGQPAGGMTDNWIFPLRLEAGVGLEIGRAKDKTL